MEGVNISAIKEEGVTACLGSSCQQMAKAVKVILVSHSLLFRMPDLCVCQVCLLDVRTSMYNSICTSLIVFHAFWYDMSVHTYVHT